MSTTPNRDNLLIRQGSREVIRFITRDFNNDLYDPIGFRMQIRAQVGGVILDEFTDASPEVTLSTGGAGYALLTLDSATTAGYTAGNYVYDAEVQDPVTSDWYRVAQGAVCVDANVTV